MAHTVFVVEELHTLQEQTSRLEFQLHAEQMSGEDG
jgi:hypothetical protein